MTKGKPSSTWVRLEEGYELVLPQEACRELGLKEGSDLVIEVDERGIHLIPFERAVRRSGALIAQFIDPSRSLSDELIRDRREEARREDEEDD